MDRPAAWGPRGKRQKPLGPYVDDDDDDEVDDGDDDDNDDDDSMMFQ